jgi:hypothetical protein
MRKKIILVAAVLLIAAGIYAQEPPAQGQTPPPQNPTDQKDVKYTNDSIARLSFVQGKVFVQRASDLGYEEGALNMPISQGDRIGTADGRAEVHFGRGNYIRLDNETKVDILNLPKKDDDIARIRVWSGNAYLVVGTLKKEKGIELHSADSSFYVLDRGVYRVNVRENKNTEIQVYQGLIEVAGEGGSTLLKASQKLEIAEGRFTGKPSSFIAVADDSFDKFNESRTASTGQEMANARLPEELSDYEGELDQYGEWTYLAPYGNVWVPNDVEDDWRPYYDGRWTWLPLSGWTWWPYEPWGWATSHYGRWNWGVGFGWYWIPQTMWGPAWVDWWWDDAYFCWAPLSYWGYPGVWYGGAYYGHYYGPYYPYNSGAMTAVRRQDLKDPHIASKALRGDSLKSLNRISMTNKTPSLRPAGNKISVQPLSGNRVMLKNDGPTGFQRDATGLRRAADGAGAASGPRAVRQPANPGQTQAQSASSGAGAKPQSVKSPSGGEKAAGSGKAAAGSGNVQKKGDSPSMSQSAATGFKSDPSIAGSGSPAGQSAGRTANGYPSSPRIKGPSSYGDSGSGRARTFSGPYSRPSTFGGSSGRTSSGGSSGSSVRSGGSRSGSSSGRSSGSVSRGSSSRGSSSRGSSGRSSGSSSRGSSGSRGSSSGSRGSSGGGAHRK